MPRGQPGVNRVLPLVPRAPPPPAPPLGCSVRLPPARISTGDSSIHSFALFLDFLWTTHKGSFHQSSNKPSSLGTSHASVCLPPLLRHCPVWGIFVVPRHPFACCLASLLKSFLLLAGSTLPLSVYSPQLAPDACVLFFPPRVSRFSK